MHPPHLPNPSCSLLLRHLSQRLGIFLLAIISGLIAGLAGGAMAIGWIWPDFGGGNYLFVSQGERGNQRIEMEEVIKKETSQKIMTVYKGTQKAGDVTYLNSQNKIGEAVLVGSDGWLAMYLENERELNTVYLWAAVNHEGSVYQVEKNLYDKFTKIVYFKIKGSLKKDGDQIKNEQFKVVGFSDGEKFGSQVFVFQNNQWLYNFLDFEYFTTEKPHLDSVPLRVVSLGNKNTQIGSLVFTTQGRLLGVINKDGEMISSIYLTRVLPGVLNKQKIIYPTLSVEGWFSTEQKIIINNEAVKGFLVVNILKNEAKLQKGDVILEINGQIVEDENIWYNLKGEKARLKIMRRGTFLDLEAQIKENIF